jgi:MFS family permease
MGEYTDTLRRPGVIRIVLSQLVARFPFGMMSLAFVLHIQQITNSYTLAGLALGLETAGVAISGPLLGRWMGPVGPRKMLLITAAISSVAILAVAFAPVPGIFLVGFCLIVGLSSPPIQMAVRTIYPTLVERKKMGVLYALDATIQEMIWIVGPVLATFVAAFISTTAGVALLAIIQMVGAIWFASTPEVRNLKIPKSVKGMGRILKNKVVVANAVMGGLLVGSFSAVEVGTIGVLPSLIEAGWVIAALSVGSLIGGLGLGHRSQTKWALSKFLFLVFLGFSAVYLAPNNPWWMAAAWFIAGIGVAPALGLLGAIIGAAVPMSDTAEAYGWTQTGQMLGYAAAASLVGFLIDAVTAEASLVVAALFAAGAMFVALVTAKITPVISNKESAH